MSEVTTYRLRDGIEPFAVYESAATAASDDGADLWCDYCTEGTDYEGPHVHELFVTREGASLHTADELVVIAHEDTEALVEGYRVPEWFADVALDANHWCENPDDSQALSDSVYELESALADAGLSITWDEGYVIERVREIEPSTYESAGAEILRTVTADQPTVWTPERGWHDPA